MLEVSPKAGLDQLSEMRLVQTADRRRNEMSAATGCLGSIALFQAARDLIRGKAAVVRLKAIVTLTRRPLAD